MTNEQYEILLSALADKIKSQGEENVLQKWEIENLKKKLENAEAYKQQKTNETK